MNDSFNVSTAATLGVSDNHSPARSSARPLTPWRYGLGVAPIDVGDRKRLLAHLRYLSDEDRQLRFLRTMPDAALVDYVAGLDFTTSTRLGMWRDDGTLMAMVEAFADDAAAPQQVELAFTTDPRYRQLGVARELYRAIAALATGWGAGRFVLYCASHNRPMRALLRTVDAETEVEAGEVRAVCRLAPRSGIRLDIDQSFSVAAEPTAPALPSAVRRRLRGGVAV